ncbi:MAG: histidine kinase dimerization/phospho-acceptor domain-containing protein [Acutalibacteraceae bacterium]|nr:histidine kinase dimerization/phospho-acceptor domain-containing protein [Acutalibacteraceae bacterium]
MKLKELKNRLWFNIFIRIAAIFAVFVLVLCLSNVTLLVRFFSVKEKRALKEQLSIVSELNFNDSATVVKILSGINEKYNFDVEIYNESGRILYTTHGSQMMDYFSLKNDKFVMTHEELNTIKSERLSGDIIFETAVRKFDQNEYLLCRKQISEGLFAEVRVQKQLISNSAAIANELIIIISVICFILSVIWVLNFARKFSKPIAEMNTITKDMAQLDFSRKLNVNRNDEIGELAASVNELSASLNTALSDLKETNAKLRSDIELERQLDVMRRGFVANVSHELKTPISIISGYAEGLKLNVSPESKEEYCNTIIDESQRMNKLVLSILELSRYESGQIPLNKESFDISPLCSESLDRIFAGKDIETENKVSENTLITADPLQIEQVLKAYLENAAAHTPEGGKVWTESSVSGNTVRISVFNTGSHIDEEVMPQIWQSFFRGDTSHKRDSTRFGLGLSIVTAIMKLHDRKCGVYNTDFGVCFWFEAEKTTEV